MSVALTRRMLWRMLGAEHPMAAHRVDSRAVHATGAMPDAMEGVMSFLEKRPATVHRPSLDRSARRLPRLDRPHLRVIRDAVLVD